MNQFHADLIRWVGTEQWGRIHTGIIQISLIIFTMVFIFFDYMIDSMMSYYIFTIKNNILCVFDYIKIKKSQKCISLSLSFLRNLWGPFTWTLVEKRCSKIYFAKLRKNFRLRLAVAHITINTDQSRTG